MFSQKHWVIAFFLLSASPAVFTGCAQNIRQYTYPPDFTYIEQKEISSAMWKLALSVASLNRVLHKPDPLGTDPQIQIVEELRKMEKIGRLLGSAGGTNHPLIDNRITAFRTDLETARRAAEQNPPNYYLAGRIAGSCSNCHMLRP